MAAKRVMKLYHSYPFRSLRCAWLIEELGATQDFTLVKTPLRGGTSSEDMAKYRDGVHPHGTIPALEIEGGPTLLESGAICLYIADLYGNLTPPLAERHRYYDWILYCCSTVDAIMDPLYWQLLHTPEEKRDHALIEEKKAQFHVFSKYLNTTLEGRDYICGKEFSAADCVLGYNMFWAGVFERGAIINSYPNVKAYGERISQRPAYQKIFKPSA